jgi:hypothetical protein
MCNVGIAGVFSEYGARQHPAALKKLNMLPVWNKVLKEYQELVGLEKVSDQVSAKKFSTKWSTHQKSGGKKICSNRLSEQE